VNHLWEMSITYYLGVITRGSILVLTASLLLFAKKVSLSICIGTLRSGVFIRDDVACEIMTCVKRGWTVNS
jgi:hypothetical protein